MKKSKQTKDVEERPESPRTVARLSKYRVCIDTVVADYRKARKNKGSFYIDQVGDPEPPHPMSFAEGGWNFDGSNGPVVRDEYLPEDPETGRP